METARSPVQLNWAGYGLLLPLHESEIMYQSSQNSDDIDHLLLNARLRDELEPFLDESIDLVNVSHMSTPKENEFLASMLAWERAPVLPISQWFKPELILPHPDMLNEVQLHRLLWEAINQLYEERIILEFTDHLSDRELYCLLYRDILPSPEKRVNLPKNYLHWHCLDVNEEPDTWLRYYANHAERKQWQEEYGVPLPDAEPTPYPRTMPRRPH